MLQNEAEHGGNAGKVSADSRYIKEKSSAEDVLQRKCPLRLFLRVWNDWRWEKAEMPESQTDNENSGDDEINKAPIDVVPDQQACCGFAQCNTAIVDQMKKAHEKSLGSGEQGRDKRIHSYSKGGKCAI